MQVFGLPGHLIRSGRVASRIAAQSSGNEAAIRRATVARWRQAMANGLSAEQAAQAVGVPRATLYRWERRAELRSRRPKRVRAKSWTPALVEAVEALRLDHPMWGRAKLGPLVRREGFALSDATIGRNLYVANAGDGSVRLFQGADYSAIGRIDLGEDADNVRVDAVTNRVFVGYGSGALAVVDPTSWRKIGDVLLKAHPESFQLDSLTSHVFVNLPDAHSIAVVDRASLHQIAIWPRTSRWHCMRHTGTFSLPSVALPELACFR